MKNAPKIAFYLFSLAGLAAAESYTTQWATDSAIWLLIALGIYAVVAGLLVVASNEPEPEEKEEYPKSYGRPESPRYR